MGGHSALDEPCTVHSYERFAVTATNRTTAFRIVKDAGRVRRFPKIHGVQVVAVALRILMLL